MLSAGLVSADRGAKLHMNRFRGPFINPQLHRPVRTAEKPQCAHRKCQTQIRGPSKQFAIWSSYDLRFACLVLNFPCCPDVLRRRYISAAAARIITDRAAPAAWGEFVPHILPEANWTQLSSKNNPRTGCVSNRSRVKKFE